MYTPRMSRTHRGAAPIANATAFGYQLSGRGQFLRGPLPALVTDPKKAIFPYPRTICGHRHSGASPCPVPNAPSQALHQIGKVRLRVPARLNELYQIGLT